MEIKVIDLIKDGLFRRNAVLSYKKNQLEPFEAMQGVLVLEMSDLQEIIVIILVTLVIFLLSIFLSLKTSEKMHNYLHDRRDKVLEVN